MTLVQRRSSALWARLAYILAAFVLVGCLQSAVVSASPTRLLSRQNDEILPNDPQDTDDIGSSGSPFDPAPLEDKYPLLPECRDKCKVDKDKSLFYSQVGKFQDKPTDFAKQEGLTLVREAYPAGFTDKRPDSTAYTKFAERFSIAFSEKTSGIAHVLLPTDGTSVDNRVWGRIEYGNLTRSGGECTRIIKVDPEDFSKRCILWDREGNYDDDNYSRCGLQNQPVPPPPSKGDSQGGTCRVHVTQYQKNEPNFSSPVYRLDVTIRDAGGKIVGSVAGVDAPTDQYVDVTSLLPYVLQVAAGEVDDSAVLFKYGDQSWGSNDAEQNCDFGGYEDGNRDGDCDFQC
ncbi:MAG: hypothetical protein Q9178_006786 [Gyalolechia marmorata]